MRNHGRRGESAETPPAEAIVYARVSSKEQEKEGFSIPAQLKLLRDYATEHGLVIRREYTDVETAKQAGRTSFNDMVAFFKSALQAVDNSCRVILVEKTDRLYRNLKDWVTLDELQLEIHFVKENVILSPDSRSTEKFMHGIKVLMAKNYIDNLSEETKKGMVEKAEQGIWPSCAPIGYINVRCGDKRSIQPDPATAQLVRTLFELYATGRYSLLEVTRKIREDGLAYRKSGNRIQKSLIHKMLTNPLYYGDIYWAGKHYSGTHEPLVSKDLWDTVQETLAEKGRRKTRQQKHQWLYRGLLRCGHCGCALTPEVKKAKYTYYHCTGHKGRCPEKYAREEELTRQFSEALRAMKMDSDVLEWLRVVLKESHRDEKEHHSQAISTFQQQYTKIQGRIDAMYEDKLDGTISREMYERKSEEWTQEQQDIMRHIETHQRANRAYLDKGVTILELADGAAALFERQESGDKRKILDTVFSNSIWKDGMLLPSYRKPFDLIVETQKNAVDNYGGKFDEVAKTEIWLPGVDSNHEPPG
ncbi:MAG: recombinase family protein [Armatimonadetes bacterium]|nr:recombinase family protein [Armatimonadota bacterium]